MAGDRDQCEVAGGGRGGNCVVMARHIRILLPAPGLVVVAWSHPGPDTDGDVGAGLGSWAARHRFVT